MSARKFRELRGKSGSPPPAREALTFSRSTSARVHQAIKTHQPGPTATSYSRFLNRDDDGDDDDDDSKLSRKDFGTREASQK